jgi:hypothetical protein
LFVGYIREPSAAPGGKGLTLVILIQEDAMKRRLSKVCRLLVRLGRDEQGGEVLEYALTLGFLALTCYVLVQMVGLKFFNFWGRIDRALYLLG